MALEQFSSGQEASFYDSWYIQFRTLQGAAAPRAVVLANSPVSTSIDQDAPSTSIPSTQEQEHSPIISQGFKESPKTPTFRDDPLHESLHEEPTSQGSSSNVRQIHTPFEHLGRWTKDHPIANVIGNPSRSVSMRKQLQTDAMWCYFDAFLTSVEPKNFKQAMTELSWIDAMQEEIHEFERLQVWELVPCPDKVLLIKLKWIYKVKTVEFGGVLKNKARLFAQEFRQEEGINFEESFASDNPSHVYKLKKALYGLKQAPRAWYDVLSNFLISQHFFKGAVDPTLFTRQAGNDLLLMSFFLGLQISQSPRGIFINHLKYASGIGKQVDATLYRGMIGSLMYLTSSRPDLIHAVYLCARGRSLVSIAVYYEVTPHLVFRCVVVIFGGVTRSTSGSAQFLVDKLVSWLSKKQKSTAISNYTFQFNKIPLYCDNKSAIALCCNNVQHSRAKYIDIRYHFIKEQVENGILDLYVVRTEYQLADIFTKPLPRERFNFLIDKLGMRSMSPETLKSLAEETDE
ncbi:retrovirus-related pol polyprotein from transposon TNT 1-94 [Tanacetum coccineum]